MTHEECCFWGVFEIGQALARHVSFNLAQVCEFIDSFRYKVFYTFSHVQHNTL